MAEINFNDNQNMNGQTRLLIIQPDNKVGGAQKVSEQILRAFQNSKVINYVEISEICDRSIVKKIIFHSVAIIRLLKKIHKFYPDIIVINGTYIYFIIPFINIFNKNIIYRESSHPKSIQQAKKIEKLWKKLAFKKTKAIIVQSESAKKKFISDWGIEKNKIIIISNFENMHENKRENQVDEINYLYVGTLDENKRVDKIINFLENNSKYNKLWIYGDGPSRYGLEKLIESLNIRPKIRLMGYKCSQEIYSRNYSGIFLASISEGSPNVLREAYARSIPSVLAKDMIGGAHEMSGNVSLIIDFNDHNILVDQRLQEFKPEYIDFQRSAGNYAAFKNSWIDVCNQIKK